MGVQKWVIMQSQILKKVLSGVIKIKMVFHWKTIHLEEITGGLDFLPSLENHAMNFLIM